MMNIYNFNVRHILIVVSILFQLFFSEFASAEEKPFIFVQSGSNEVGYATCTKERLVTISGHHISLWDTESGREIRKIKLKDKHSSAILYEPTVSLDGKRCLYGWNMYNLENGNSSDIWNELSAKWDRDAKYLKEKHKEELDQLIEDLKNGKINKEQFLELRKNTRLRQDKDIQSVTLSKSDLNVVTGAKVSQDGKKIIVPLWRRLLVIDATDYQVDSSIQVDVGSITAFAVSYDLKNVVIGSNDGQVILYDLISGKKLRSFSKTLLGHSGSITALSISPVGGGIISGDENGTVICWHATNGDVTWKENYDRHTITSIKISPNGKDAIINASVVNYMASVASGEYTKTSAIAFLNEDKGFVISESGKGSKFVDRVNGATIQKFTGRASEISSLAFSPDGNYLMWGIAGEKKPFKVWDMNTWRPVDLKKVFERSNEYISGATGIKFFPDSKSFLSIAENGIELRKVPNGEETEMYLSTNGVNYNYTKVYDLSSDGKRLVLGQINLHANSLTIWDIDTKKLIKIVNVNGGNVKKVILSPNARFVVAISEEDSGGGKSVRCWDVERNEMLWKFSHIDVANFDDLHFSRDGRMVFVALQDNKLNREVKLFDVPSGNIIGIIPGLSGPLQLSPDGLVLAGTIGDNDNNAILHYLKNTEKYSVLKGHESGITGIVFSPDGKKIISASKDGSVRFWDIETGRELVRLFIFPDNEWVVISPEGYYDSSEYGDKYVNVRLKNAIYGIDQFRESYYRPDLVKMAFAGISLENYRNLASVKSPPRVSIVDTKSSMISDDFTIKLKVDDTGGGIGDVRIFLNGSAIKLDSGRGVKIVENRDDRAVYKNYVFKLAKGENTITAIVFNADNSVQSNPVEFLVKSSFNSMRKPALHALVIGIQEFKNPKLTLKYSVADALLFADTLQNGGNGLFETVTINRLTTKEATSKNSIIDAFNKYMFLNPDDLFIFYVASHGTVDDGEYFLITSNVGSISNQKLRNDAISQNELKELIANVPSTKKMIIIDTCNAGKLGEGIQTALITRGMSEDTAIKVLSRAVGSTILSAATSAQEALEGHKGHGLFTWALVEGWKGKADKGMTGYIKTNDLASYVDDEVPTLAEKLFNHAQYPTISTTGQGFPVGRVVQ